MEKQKKVEETTGRFPRAREEPQPPIKEEGPIPSPEEVFGKNRAVELTTDLTTEEEK